MERNQSCLLELSLYLRIIEAHNLTAVCRSDCRMREANGLLVGSILAPDITATFTYLVTDNLLLGVAALGNVVANFNA